MIVKRNFNILRVAGYVRTEILWALVVCCLFYVLHESRVLAVSLPFTVSATLGSALAIFIAFRNNNAYGRWWEARTLWGGIVNSSRVLARLIISFADSHSHQSTYNTERSEEFKRTMTYYVIAWAHALRMHLRNEHDLNILHHLLSNEDVKEVIASENKPNAIHMLISKRLYRAMADGTLGGFDSFQIEGQLLALANYQGGCERIKNTPLLRQYDYFTRLFLYTFITLLPFSLISEFERLQVVEWMIPIAIIISTVFAIIGKVGEVNEDPFENRITDVPLTSLCITIERELRDMLGERDLPSKPEPVNGYIY